ncbi:MAG: hypothetical protein RR472_04310, partial [Anaerovoracaceae bacterium]
MIYLSSLAHPLLYAYLSEKDEITTVGPTDLVYPQISTHPDIYYCDLGNMVYKGKKEALGSQYPQDILYNAACTGKYFIHNLKYTSPALLEIATAMNMVLINVKQGYTKCNTVIVDERSVIISDEGMARALGEAGLDVLLVSPGFVQLPGFDYGFLGGASGRIGNEIVFNGNLEDHPNYEGIVSFIQQRGVGVKYFHDYPLTDIGSIIW